MLLNYFKLSIRSIKRRPIYAAINIGGLAVGLAACLLIGLYVADELSYDRFNRHFEHIYRVVECQKQADGYHQVAVTPGPLAAALQRDFPEIAATTRVGQWHTLLQNGERKVEPKKTLIVDPSFFSIFDFELLLGDASSVLLHPDEIIITEMMAESLWGTNWQKEIVVGKSLIFNGPEPLRVVGVAANPPVRSHLQFEVLLPFKYLEKVDEWSMKWNSNSYHTYLQLQPTANVAAFEQKIAHQLQAYANVEETTMYLQALRSIYLYSKFDFDSDWGTRSDIFYVRVFVLVGFIVLLIAILNYVNLATARASQRATEVGVRKSVGAGKWQLMRQFLSEAFLVTSMATLLSLFLASTSTLLFKVLSDKTLQIPFGEPKFWAGVAAAVVVISLLAGTYPAFVLSSFYPTQAIRGGQKTQSGLGLRQTLVIGQFFLAVVLSTGAVVIYQQLRFVQHKKLGFDQSQLLYLRLKGDTRGKSLVLKETIGQLPSVASVSATTSNLVDVSNSSNLEREGQAELLITQMNVDADFLETTGMTLATGRNFSATIPGDTTDAFGRYLINETAAAQLGYTPTTALGQKIKFWGLDGEVIGVVRDFHFQPLDQTIAPFILRFRPKEFYFNLLIKIKPDQTLTTVAAIEKIYQKADAANPVSYGFVDQDLEKQYRAEQRTGQTLLSFSILAILLSCLGLLGLVTFIAEQRTKEIGIRKVLGASVASITGLLAKDFVKLVVVAIVVASPVAYFFMNKWLSDFAYRIDMEWWMFALAGGLAVGIAFLTVGFQAVRAAMANPVRSLRSE
jgi:putative ABC transport system permease protein